MTMPPNCGPAQPGTQPSPFDWWLIAAIIAAGGVLWKIHGSAVSIFNIPVGQLQGYIAAADTAAVAGALAVLVLVAYYFLKPDGCLRGPSNGQSICIGGLVDNTVHNDPSVIKWIAPFALPPEGYFDVVVKSMYWKFVVTPSTLWVNCNSVGAALLRCVVENPASCPARWGSMIGALAAAVPAIYAGIAVAGAIIAACAVTGPFVFLCVLAALLVAALIAAAITYAGAELGGLIGEAAAGPGSRSDYDFPSLQKGTIVTVKGNWVLEPSDGYNELLYTTSIGRNGVFPGALPPYTTAQADSTAADDCGGPVIL
jgi:hypothetical protein